MINVPAGTYEFHWSNSGKLYKSSSGKLVFESKPGVCVIWKIADNESANKVLRRINASPGLSPILPASELRTLLGSDVNMESISFAFSQAFIRVLNANVSLMTARR